MTLCGRVTHSGPAVTNYVICCGFPKSSTLFDRVYNSDRAEITLSNIKYLEPEQRHFLSPRKSLGEVVLRCKSQTFCIRSGRLSVSKIVGSNPSVYKFLEGKQATMKPWF